MVAEIEMFRKQAYLNNIQLLSMQRQSRFAPFVSEAAYTGSSVTPVSYVGATTMDRQTSRAENKIFRDPPTSRRWISPSQPFYRATTIEKDDEVKNLDNVKGGYAESFTNAAKVAMDDEIIAAAFGSAKTGADGSSTTSFSAGQQIAATVGASAATGLNYAKLVEVIQLFATNEVDLDMEGPIYMGISPKGNSALLKQAEIIQNKYNIKATITNGRVTEMAGINFIMTNRLPTNGSGYVRCPVWVKSGLHLGTWAPLTGNVYQDMNKALNPAVVEVSMIIGATRLDEVKVAEVISSE